MTPKKKAKELVDEYFSWYGNEEYFSYEFAKQCALIAVDEIMDCLNTVMIPNPFKPYWEEVKREINLL